MLRLGTEFSWLERCPVIRLESRTVTANSPHCHGQFPSLARQQSPKPHPRPYNYPGIDLLALFIDGRRNDHLYYGNVVAGYCLRGQATVRHLGDKCFERAIVDFGQRQISDT